jgi:hypothetical protein
MARTKRLGDLPVLRGFVKGKHLYVFCPYCDRWHLHGAEDELPPTRPMHRQAHCSAGSPLLKRGYYVATWKKADRAWIQGE